ncbi:MAG TPA: CDP-alcohol phosphatidyltransferase family protein, partial [Vicinamibacterales bacterium]
MAHIRDNRSVLAAAEKRLLVWIARNLPPSVNSDRLSALALVSMLGAGAAFAFISLSPWSATIFIVLLVLNWFGDSLDGTVARVRDRQRPRYGFYVDHVIDLTGAAAVMSGMALSGAMTPAIGFALLAVYLIVAAETFLATHSVGVFRVSFAGFGPTELRVVLAAGAMKVASSPTVELMGREFQLLDVGGVVAIVGLAVTFVVSAIRNGAALYRTEPLPVPD